MHKVMERLGGFVNFHLSFFRQDIFVNNVNDI